MKAILTALVLLLLGATVGILPFPAAHAADLKPDGAVQWQYRVLTEEQVIALGNKDLGTGLNKLGDEGWELVAVGAHYIFKRPKDQVQKQVAEIKQRIAVAEADVEAWKERVAWSERMLRKGYMTEKHLETERAQLAKAQTVLDVARESLKNLPSAPKEPEPTQPKPER